MKGIWKSHLYSFDNQSSQSYPATRVLNKLNNFVDQIVLAAINKGQVVQRVICWIVVNVVYMLVRCQGAIKMFCHYNAMLENPSTPALIMPDLLIEIPMPPNTHGSDRKDIATFSACLMSLFTSLFQGKRSKSLPFKQIKFGFLKRSPRQAGRDFGPNINGHSPTVSRVIFMKAGNTASANSFNGRIAVHTGIGWFTYLFTPYLFGCTRVASCRSTVAQLLSTIQTAWQRHRNPQMYCRLNCNLKHRICQEVVA